MSKVKKGSYSSEEASSSSGTSSSLSSDEEIEARDLKPIKDYLLDRRDLARQLFKSVKAEKIQMMLPQVLKKMDFGQLEELCANELSGMSKARILCILNGKTMAESSDTSESDDSGPSLEIISDTEEWFSDEDVSKKDEGKGKIKRDGIKQKGKLQPQKKGTNKQNQKKISDITHKNVQVKKEEDIEKSKEKDGDSLLDLLELEMRARAIRALIRKEENIIPDISKSTEGNDASVETARGKAEQDELKAKENCRRQLEMIISAQQTGTAEDEDVVLVVQPTPTIELLSSESEGECHSGVRINKKLQNERVMETEDNVNHSNNGNSNNTTSENSVDNLKENKTTGNLTEEYKAEVLKRDHSNNIVTTDTQSKSNGKKKKTKKKSHSKEQSKNAISKVSMHKTKSSTEYQDIKNIKIEGKKLNENEDKNDSKSKVEQDDSLSKKRSSIKPLTTVEKAALDEEKSIDLDEIIDLDDYCDDMDDIENNENDKNKNKEITETEQVTSQAETPSQQKSNETETWASRYYQTDDVQSVIKESKIQSEIRKRLRERQRLSKLSTSPNKNSPSSPPSSEVANKIVAEKDPLGSVDEYLALKYTGATSLNTGSDPNVMKDSDNTSTAIEDGNMTVAHSEMQDIHGEISLTVNPNFDTELITKKGKETVSTNNSPNSG
ncbi:uncharacterized protein LOC143180364 [Calliopsis andreniformis]|uniref:uncharacterized protein LOC143180364 n=1 Tax=Calliopsis andreniformis TaxID=337506 RepID=UPI003FCCD4C1